MYYTITTKDFAKQSVNCELIAVQDDLIYLQSEDKLAAPFASLLTLPTQMDADWQKRLSGVRASKEEAINEAYEALISEGVEYEGARYACGTATQQALVFASLFGGAVKASDGTAQTLSKSQITALGKQIAARIAALDARKAELLAALNALTRMSAISAFEVDFSAIDSEGGAEA